MRAGRFPILSGPAALMAFDLGSRKLFWSIFSQTVSVLVANSARLSPGEIVVDLLAWHLAFTNRISGMAKLAVHLSWCAVLQLHFPNDQVKPAGI